MTAGHEGILIQIQNLSKGFEGRPVLRHLTASFPSGRIIGLLGTNGIGKTTLLSMIGGLMEPDEGQVTVAGKSAWLPERENFYPFFRVRDAIQYYRDFFDDFDACRADQLCREYGLEASRKIARMSRGEKERLCLFLTLCRDVPLYLMDEPAAGFDPKLKRDIVKILLENLREGSTVLVATHLLRDLGELLDTVAILTENGIVLEDADAIRETGKSIEEYYLEVVQ